MKSLSIQLFFKPGKWIFPAIIVLCLFPLLLGILPGWKKMQSDFPNYFVAASIVVEGQNADSLYHSDWFQNQLYSHGFSEQGKFSPFPPPTAFILLPFVGFDALTAKRIWLIFNILLIIPIVLLMSRITGLPGPMSLLIFLMSGMALVNNLYLGQMYLMLLLFLLTSYFLVLKGYASSTGFFLGTGIAIKYFPLVFIPTLISERRWKTLLSASAVFLLFHIVALILLGSNVYSDYFHNVLFQHLNGNLEGQSPWSSSFQSWNSLGHQLFLSDNIENPHPYFPSEKMYVVYKFFIYSFTLIAGVILYLKFRKQPDFIEASLSLTAMTILVLSPASASYHGLLLLFPVSLMGNILLVRGNARGFILLILLTGLIGFLPWLLEVLSIRSTSIALTYTRLWLNAILYVVIYIQLFNYSKSNPLDVITGSSPNRGVIN